LNGAKIVKVGWKILTAAAILGFAFIASAVIYFRTEGFQEFARTRIVSSIQSATGLECRIERTHIDGLRGRIEISGLELFPKGAARGPLNLKVENIKARMSISSFWHFRVRLSELNIDRPRVDIISSSNQTGAWNPEEFLRTLKISLRLEASKVLVLNGRLKVNELSSPFNLSFEHLDCEVRYSKRIPSYKIKIAYSKSRLFWENRNIVHDLEVDADLSSEGIAIDYFKFRHDKTLFIGSGSFKDWRNPVLSIHSAGILNAKDLTLATPSLYEGRGEISVAADMRFDQNGVYSKGRFSARTGGYRKMPYANLTGGYEIQRDIMNLREVSGTIGNGSFLLNADIQLKSSNKAPNVVRVSTKNVSLVNAGKLLNLPMLYFENTADATTTLTWYAGRDLRADCAAKLNSHPQTEARSGRSTLLEGYINFTYFESGTVQISSASLKSPHTTVQASGGEGALFKIQMTTNRFSEPLSLIAGFSPPISELINKHSDLMEIGGNYDFDGNVKIRSASDVDYDGTIQVRNGNWRSIKIDRLSTQARFSSPDLKLNSLEVHRGSQTAQGQLEIELPGGEQVSKLKFQGEARNVALESLKDFGIESRFAGSLSGKGTIEYDRESWAGGGQLLVEKGSLEGQPFDQLRVRAQLENRRLRLIQAEAVRGSARLSADGEIRLDAEELHLSTRLNGLPLKDISLVGEKKLPVQGRLNASGTLSGTLDKPAFLGDFELVDFFYDTWNLGRGTGTVNFKDGKVQGSASIHPDFGSFVFHADLSADGKLPGKVNVEFENLDIQKIIPGKAPDYFREISTALKGKVDIEGPLADFDALSVSGELDGAHFKVQDYELRNSGQVKFSLVNRNFRMENVKMIGEGTSLVLNGSIPLDSDKDLGMDLKGNLNLQFLEGIEKKLHASGGAALDIRANGTRENPQIIGRVAFQDAKLDYPDFPFRFSSMQGDMVFSRNLVRFENVHGTASSGTIQMSGIIEHRNTAIQSIRMGIALRNVRFPFPKDFRSVADADLVLTGTSDVQILSGDVNVIRSDYIRGFNLLEQLTSRSVVQTGPLTTSPLMLGLRLNIDIHSDSGLYIDNELARLRGSLRLTLQGTPAYPSLTGRVEAGDGTIFFRGNRFEISHAYADFLDRNRINPVLEIRAEANVKTYRLILDAIGDLDHLTLNVTSDPPMSTVDILSLLTTGKADTSTTAASGSGTSAANSRRESQMTGLSAASVLSENLTGVIGKRVQRIFGLESFRVDPFLAGAENDPTARVTISERLAKDLVVTFSRNLTTSQEQIVIIEYDVTKDLSVVATRDEDGKYGLDFRFRKRLR
jgi:translocation and assembly module TamB